MIRHALTSAFPITCLVVSALVLSAPSGFTQIVTEDFSGATPGTNITTGNTIFTTVTTTGTAAATFENSIPAFGGNYGNLDDPDDSSRVSLTYDTNFSAAQFSLSFQFYDASPQGMDNDGGLNVRAGDGNAGSSTAGPDLRLQQGSISYHDGSGLVQTGLTTTSYALNTLHSVTIAANSEASTVDGVDPDTFNLYFNGSLIGQNLSFRNSIGTFDYFDFASFTGLSPSDISIDNIAGYDSVIPEPSTLAMLAGGIGMLFLLRRRVRS